MDQSDVTREVEGLMGRRISLLVWSGDGGDDDGDGVEAMVGLVLQGDIQPSQRPGGSRPLIWQMACLPFCSSPAGDVFAPSLHQATVLLSRARHMQTGIGKSS